MTHKHYESTWENTLQWLTNTIFNTKLHCLFTFFSLLWSVSPLQASFIQLESVFLDFRCLGYGTGNTWIARYVRRHLLSRRGCVILASTLVHLNNSTACLWDRQSVRRLVFCLWLITCHHEILCAVAPGIESVEKHLFIADLKVWVFLGFKNNNTIC